MAYNYAYSGPAPLGATPHGAEYAAAAARYGGSQYGGYVDPSLAAQYAGLGLSMPQTSRPNPKPKARARDAAAQQQQQQPQPRHDENNDIGDGLEENCFALVSTSELEQQGLKKHPDKIAEAASLNSVTLPVGKYKLGLPAFIIQGKTALTLSATPYY